MSEQTPAPVPTPPPAAPPAPPAPSEPDRGFPEGTPLVEMTVDQQAAYWKHQARKHEQRAESRKDYDQVLERAKKWDQLEESQRTPSEQAVKAAREEGRAAALREANERTAVAILRAGLQARGKSSEEANEILAALSPGAFVKNDDVDTDKVAAYVEKIAGPTTAWPDTGGGRRGGATTMTAAEAGLAEAKKRFQAAFTGKQ